MALPPVSDLDDHKTPLQHRAPALILALLGTIYDDPDPIPWNSLVEHFASQSDYTSKTIENTLADLAAFGAIQRIGQYTPKHDTRAVRATTLGQAWLDQTILDLPNTEADP